MVANWLERWRWQHVQHERRWRAEARWQRLAVYNAEVARGIVHTAEWNALMAEEQRAFDEAQQ